MSAMSRLDIVYYLIYLPQKVGFQCFVKLGVCHPNVQCNMFLLSSGFLTVDRQIEKTLNNKKFLPFIHVPINDVERYKCDYNPS